ncbi:hypothetical protein GCM10009425_38110 [Pseudomonas asuensis]|uniref:Uncharacterized protein n=1 Tax=Pseudomonas asuensis TaxID=1825787 RepID=A0ABQ2H2B6_9PSED|nr:hypothetical protein GCM10009425_38110 [Pseudomonas asuensis]
MRTYTAFFQGGDYGLQHPVLWRSGVYPGESAHVVDARLLKQGNSITISTGPLDKSNEERVATFTAVVPCRL